MPPPVHSATVRFLVAVALVSVGLIATIAASRGPAARPASAPPDVFSAERARDVLQRLVGDGIPHPVGSPQNAVVRDRVLAEFRALGYDPVVERDLACAPIASCAWVENILVTLPGREPGPAVMLNAHYDSVPAGPGAGDLATGVASIIEIARALRAIPQPRYPILFLVDDGEEAGLLGAEAFVKRHRPADYASVLVLEARGSSGRTLMFETSQDNRALIDAYARSVPRPSTSSVYFSVYQRLPNGTNFTTFKGAGIKGMAAAFIGDPAQYHTPLNRVENVPDGTIQHMGDTALGVTREIAENGLLAERGNASYFDVVTLAVVRWPERFNLPAGVVASLLLMLLAAMQLRAQRFAGRELAWSIAMSLLPLALAGLAGFAVSSVVAPRLDDAEWPASGSFLVLSEWGCGLAAVALAGMLARGKVGSAAAWTAVWILASILGIAVALLLPGAAYLFVIPSLLAATSGAVAWLRRKRADSAAALILPLVAISLLMFPFALDLFEAMGAGVLVGVAILVAIAFAPFLPLLVETRWSPHLAAIALGLVIAAAGTVFVVPVYSAQIPRPVSLVYQMDREALMAHWLVDMRGSVMPAALGGAANWRETSIPSLAIGRTDRARVTTAAELPPGAFAFPEVRLVSIEPRGPRTMLRVEIRSPRGARVMRVRFDLQYSPRLQSLGDVTFESPARINGVIVIHNVPPEGVIVGVEVDASAAGGVFAVDDETPGLPAIGAPLLEARQPDSVPAHRGDRTLLTTLGRV